MVVEDLDDLRLLDAGDALALLGVVDEDHPPRRRRDEVGAGDQADRPLRRVDRDRGAVVDVLDLLGDVAEQIVGPDGQRLGVGQRPAWRRQGDHPARDVGVERADDHGGATSRARARGSPRAGLGAVAGDEQRGAELERLPLRIGAVADDDDVAVGDLALAGLPGRSSEPRRGPRSRRRRRTTSSPSRTATIASTVRRRVDQARGLARLADVAVGEDPLGHHPDQARRRRRRSGRCRGRRGPS